MPERTWRRWPALDLDACHEALGVGPPQDLGDGWSDGHVVSEATVLRALRDEGLILPVHYQRERRKLAERRKTAFASEPTRQNQVWQLDFSEFETTIGGTWRRADGMDYWSEYEHPFPVFPTADRFDAIDVIELALADYEAVFGHPFADLCRVEVGRGEIGPVVTIVTDNGGPSRAAPRPDQGAHPGDRTVHATAGSGP